jgi:hypothetical protein
VRPGLLRCRGAAFAEMIVPLPDDVDTDGVQARRGSALSTAEAPRVIGADRARPEAVEPTVGRARQNCTENSQ